MHAKGTASRPATPPKPQHLPALLDGGHAARLGLVQQLHQPHHLLQEQGWGGSEEGLDNMAAVHDGDAGNWEGQQLHQQWMKGGGAV